MAGKKLVKIEGLNDRERELVIEALTILRAERAKAWNAACDVRESEGKRNPSLTKFDIDDIKRLGRRFGGKTHWME